MAAPTVSSTTVCSSSTSITVASGEALFWIGGNHQGDVTGVTYNGVSMTEVCAANTAFNENVHIFYLASPSVGTFNCIPTFSGGSGSRGDAIVVAGQKTSGQPIAFNTNGSTTWLNQSSPSDNTLFLGGSYGEASLTMDTGYGLTELDNYSGASYENFALAKGANDAGIQTFSWTQSSGQRNAVATVALEGSSSTTFPIQYDNFTNGGETTSASSKTTSHTTGSLTNGILVAHIGTRVATTSSNGVVSGVTYNGTALTKLRSDLFNVDPYVREELWYLVAPASGAHDVVVTMAGVTDRIDLLISTWQGVDQTTPFETNSGTGTITTNATSVTTNITPSSNNNVILDSMYTRDDVGVAANSNQNELGTAGSTDTYGASYKRQATAASTSMNWTWTNSDGYAHGVGVLKPVSTSTTHVGSLLTMFQ